MDILNSLCEKHGFSAAGVCSFDHLIPFMRPEAHMQAAKLVPHAATVFVVLLPYFAGDMPGNLSLYARGQDYHCVMHDMLAPFAAQLTALYGCRAVPLADDSPLPEVQAARLSGVGKIGGNGLVFDANYGSYVFIGTILTDLPFTPSPSVSAASPANSAHHDCTHCGACVRICPLGALQTCGKVKQGRCLSALTQQGGNLPQEAAVAVSAHPLIWGCDLCQRVCPLNRGVKLTAHPAFRENLVHTLTASDLSGLTRRAFIEKYPRRAFTWRGPAPLRRNLKLKEGKS